MSIPALIARPLGRPIITVSIGEDAQVARAAPICSGVWAAVRDGAGETYDFTRTGTAYFTDIQCCGTANQYQSITRIIMVADLSALSGTKAGGLLRVWATGTTETLASQSVIVTDAAPAAPALIVYGDYANVGAIAYSAAVTLAAIAANAYRSFALNAAAVAAVNSAIGVGYVSLAIRIQADQANAEPTWGSAQKAQLTISSHNHGTAAQRPMLLLW
uniref:Tail protein n=1 Tax=viral metagenome TaxID=1070528 RepID=A0A6H1ZYC3_9ZZZZ